MTNKSIISLKFAIVNMKLKHIIVILFSLSFLLPGCVTRVDIPEEEDKMFHIELEMMRAEDISATLQTSNNLQGTFPIEYPEDAVVKLGIEGDGENVYFLEYNRDNGKYERDLTNIDNDIVIPTRTMTLSAEVPGSDIPVITASTVVPIFGQIGGLEITESELVPFQDLSFWEYEIEMSLMPVSVDYYQLLLEEQLAVLEIAGSDSTYIDVTTSPTNLDIVSYGIASSAIREFNGEEGVFIDVAELDGDLTFSLRVRSSHPVTGPEILESVSTKLISLTEDGYNYKRGLHNIAESQNSIFGEKAIYRQNIRGGLGIFTACVAKDEKFPIR